jgi:hypothetical protein
MKTITNEIKVKVLAQYLGSEIEFLNGGINWTRDRLDFINLQEETINFCQIHNVRLLLTPLENISDKHLNLLGYNYKRDFFENHHNSDLYWSDLDIIRQLGYATDFTTIVNNQVINYSVNELIELNIIKLKK